MSFTSSTFDPGDRIAHLVVQGELGHGGMGVVYRALDERLERVVAVKVLHASLAKRELVCSSFLEEARAMARVQHPHVIPIYSFGELSSPTRPYLTMELIEGSPLSSRMRESPFSDRAALRILYELAQALEAIHASGTIHGDVSARNTLLRTRDDKATLTDFGLTTDALIEADEIYFTPRYAAPERIRGDLGGVLRSRSDNYAWGVLAHELLAKVPLFTGPRISVVAQHLHKAPVSLQERRPDLCPLLCELVDLALEKAPEDRPSSEAMVDTMRRVIEEQKKPQALLIDPDATFREFAQTQLSAYTLVSAHADHLEANQELDAHDFELVVLDLDLSAAATLELTRRAKSIGAQVIIVTAAGDAKDWSRLSAAGADAFLVKPIEARALRDVAKKLLRRAR